MKLRDWYQHALAAWPLESCGYFDVHGNYVPCRNVASDPANNFMIDPRSYDPRHVLVICHSHTSLDTDHPSAADMRSEIATGVPHALICTDGTRLSTPLFFGDKLPRPALLRRQYIHGVQDCYSVCRDFYSMVCGLKIPEYPRDIESWKDGEDLYTAHLASAGFVEIPMEEVKPGDGLLFAFQSKVLNHAAVILPGDQILHHLQGKLSRRGSLSEYLPHAKCGVRNSSVIIDEDKLHWALEVGDESYSTWHFGR
jgi:proteasome lid subunit RPN8/RPN11